VREAASGGRERLVPGSLDRVVLDDRDLVVEGVFDAAASRLVVVPGVLLTCHVWGGGIGSEGGNAGGGCCGDTSDST
jgi:hypothetical protein